MSDFVKRIMLAGAGLSLTAVVIVIYLTTFNRLKHAAGELEFSNKTQQALIENYAITRYDQSYIYGSQVISFLKSNWAAFEKVTLNSGKGEYTIPDTDNLRDTADDSYINSNSIYHVTLEENDNGVPCVVIITLSNQ